MLIGLFSIYFVMPVYYCVIIYNCGINCTLKKNKLVGDVYVSFCLSGPE